MIDGQLGRREVFQRGADRFEQRDRLAIARLTAAVLAYGLVGLTDLAGQFSWDPGATPLG